MLQWGRKMDITTKIDKLLGEEGQGKWHVDMGVAHTLMDKKTQVEIIWKPGQKEVKVQFRKLDGGEYIGHTMVQTKGMKSKDFMKWVNKDMKNIWKAKKRGMKEAYSLKDVPKEFMGDPLYKAVLTAKDKKSYEKALNTLLSIRGRGAVDALKHAMGKGKK